VKWQRVNIKAKLEKLNEDQDVHDATKFLAAAIGFVSGLFSSPKK
jgi:hypothetical protein